MNIDNDKFKEILYKHCVINKVHFTSNEEHTIIDALNDYANKLNISDVSNSVCDCDEPKFYTESYVRSKCEKCKKYKY